MVKDLTGLKENATGRAYLEYYEITGGEPFSYGYGMPIEIYERVEALGGLQGLYRACIGKRIKWEELLGSSGAWDQLQNELLGSSGVKDPLQEELIRIPLELREYITLEEGKLIELKEIPEELKEKVQELKQIYRRAKDPEDLAEYRK